MADDMHKDNNDAEHSNFTTSCPESRQNNHKHETKWFSDPEFSELLTQSKPKWLLGDILCLLSENVQ